MLPSPCIEIGPEERRQLLAIARDAISAAVGGSAPTPPDPESLPALLREPRAVFVTLTRRGALRGCIGTLEAQRPLAAAVARAACDAATRDPRFPALRPEELPHTRVAIAVLSPLTPLEAIDRTALLDALRPGEDGLLIEDGSRRATFLPSVWEQLPRPEQFLAHLMAKAGLPGGHWSPQLRAYRYRSESFSEQGKPPGGRGERRGEIRSRSAIRGVAQS